MWECDRLACRYANATRAALEDVSLRIDEATVTAVLGPNGSGKSTLLRALLGTIAPSVGSVRFKGRTMAAWGRRQLAREVGVVTQEESEPFPLTVRELVAMGRYPHLGPWRREAAHDAAAIAAAMERCDVMQFADRGMSTLSGGERQRARIARALAQEPGALVLDEPTASLDIRHEMTIFELLRTLRGTGVTVLLVTHHLNLAARYADRVVLLDDGHVAADGRPNEVVTAPLIEGVYGWAVDVTTYTDGAPQIVPRSGSIYDDRGARASGRVSQG